MKDIQFLYRVIFTCFLFTSFMLIGCNADEEFTIEGDVLPAVSFDEESGIYTVKAGRSVTVTPTITDAHDPVYTWKYDGKIVSNELVYTYQSKVDGTGSFIHHFRVDASNGSLQDSVRIDVVEQTPPVISFAVPEEGYITVITGNSYLVEPNVKFGEEATFQWMWAQTKEVIGTEQTYLFERTDIGTHVLSLTVTNEDGTTTGTVQLKVVEEPGLTLSFEQEVYTVPLGRSLMLVPDMMYSNGNTSFEWLVDGFNQLLGTQREFVFTPDTEDKRYEVTVRATEGEEATEVTVTVHCTGPEGTYRYPVTPTSSAYSTKVFEYLPAPGQFINELLIASTQEEANRKAQETLAKNSCISLGGFGGYIIVGFDHSIENKEGAYDFAVYGNAFSGSSEPGIVWVMQDENGNGLPDDTWYELRGSETGKPETIRNYAVTYYKPAGIQMSVQWTDNTGGSGVVGYLGNFHTQPYYYPEWVKTQSYTLRGTRLEQRTTQNEKGEYFNHAYDWGYADNAGEDAGDRENIQASTNPNFFKIDNAMYPNGDAVKLEYIDFIKVHTGVNGHAGWLGEISTEVFGFRDMHIE